MQLTDLPVGDYLLGPGLAVERKSPADLGECEVLRVGGVACGGQDGLELQVAEPEGWGLQRHSRASHGLGG